MVCHADGSGAASNANGEHTRAFQVPWSDLMRQGSGTVSFAKEGRVDGSRVVPRFHVQRRAGAMTERRYLSDMGTIRS
jgi:hypothetical protein